MNALVKIEPIPLPDLRKPTATPLLPAWLISQRATIGTNLQIQGDRFQDAMTLPAARMPTEAQRAAINRHLANLNSCLQETPENGTNWVAETLTTITKMLTVLGGMKASELAAEAKAEAYMVALEDVPSWAVVATSRRWYRGGCGNDENGRPYDYRFMPDPAAMRRLSIVESYRARGQIRELQEVLDAVPFRDCSAELERGRLAMRGLHTTMAEGGDVEALNFADAVSLGAKVEATEPVARVFKPMPTKDTFTPLTDEQLRAIYPPRSAPQAEAAE